jgi:hypothetical protein
MDKLKYDELPFKFWKEYEQLCYLGRKQKIKELVLLKNLKNLKKCEDEVFEYTITCMIQDYIDDVLEYVVKPQTEGGS